MPIHDRKEWWLQVSYMIHRGDQFLLILCSHMTCKKCKYEFCWVCMGAIVLGIFCKLMLTNMYTGPWSEHGTSWYNCNRYDESSGVEARDAQARSRASLERYLHVYLSFFLVLYSSSLTFDVVL